MGRGRNRRKKWQEQKPQIPPDLTNELVKFEWMPLWITLARLLQVTDGARNLGESVVLAEITCSAWRAFALQDKVTNTLCGYLLMGALPRERYSRQKFIAELVEEGSQVSDEEYERLKSEMVPLPQASSAKAEPRFWLRVHLFLGRMSEENKKDVWTSLRKLGIYELQGVRGRERVVIPLAPAGLEKQLLVSS